MKRIAALAVLAVVSLTTGCLEEPGAGPRSYNGPLLRYHFAGYAGLPAGTNMARFKEIFSAPASAALRRQVAEKVAATTLPLWRADLPAGATDQSALLQPLVEDFLREEAYVEVRGAAGRTATVLAVNLTAERAGAWGVNLKRLMRAWKLGAPQNFSLAGYSGWEVKRKQSPNTFRFVLAGKWVLISLSQDGAGLLPELLQTVKQTGRPLPALKEPFLDLAVDFPGLRSWFPALAKFPLPPVRATMSPRGADVRTEVRFQYSGKVRWTSEPWRIPKKLVSEPLISFTAIRGVGPLLKRFGKLTEMGLDPVPSQWCLWGAKNDQCRLYYATPVEGATNIMSRVSLALPKMVRSSLTNTRGDFYYETSRFRLVWGNLPFIMPTMQPFREKNQEYLVGGMTLLPPNPTPVPDALFAQLRGRTNLVYYDWELTQERMNHGKQMYQLASILTGRGIPATNTASKIWFDAIRSKMGNTVTEIVQTGPKELVLVRKSVLGFTAFELATLSTWLDSPGFPDPRLELPPPLQRGTGTREAGKKPAGKGGPVGGAQGNPSASGAPPAGRSGAGPGPGRNR